MGSGCAAAPLRGASGGTCPPVSPAAIGRVTAQKLAPGSPTGRSQGAFETCSWAFVVPNGGKYPPADSTVLTVTKGIGTYATDFVTIKNNDVQSNATDAQTVQQLGAVSGCAPPGKPANSGQCNGLFYVSQPVPIKGFLPKSFEQPADQGAGALVEFVWKGNTYRLLSTRSYDSGPNPSDPTVWVTRETLGPDEPQLLALARLIVSSGFTPPL